MSDSAKERAEKIAVAIHCDTMPVIELIAAELEAYAEEAREEANEKLKQNFKHWTDVAKAEGRRAGLEEAAKLIIRATFDAPRCSPTEDPRSHQQRGEAV